MILFILVYATSILVVLGYFSIVFTLIQNYKDYRFWLGIVLLVIGIAGLNYVVFLGGK